MSAGVSPGYILRSVLGRHSKPVSSVKFSPDGRLLASAAADKTICIWDLSNSSMAAELQGHSQGISDVEWCEESNVASASDDKTIKVWDVQTGQEVRALHGHESYVFSLGYCSDSKLLVSGSYDEHVRLWDIRTGQTVRTIEAHSDPVTSVEFNKVGTNFVTGSHDGLIRIWDTGSGQCVKTLFAEGTPPVSCVRYAPNRKFVLASTLDGTIRLWQTSQASCKCVKMYKGHVNNKHCIFVGFSVQSGKYIVSGSEDGHIYFWDINSKTMVQKLEGHTDAVLGVSIHPTEELIASGGTGQDCSVRLWGKDASTEAGMAETHAES